MNLLGILGEFIPFKGYFTMNEDKEELPILRLSLITPGIKNPLMGNGFVTKTNAIQSNVCFDQY